MIWSRKMRRRMSWNTKTRREKMKIGENEE
jgi:hypothetical protein